jgi:hypothetical protein
VLAGIVDQRTCWGGIIVVFAVVCWCDDHSTHGWGSNVGVVVGRRLWTVDALG